jgi:nucleoside-diphosphate-sugar epimerase
LIRVLVTGANGFVGRSLVPYLAGKGFEVIAVVRSTPPTEPLHRPILAKGVGDLTSFEDWGELFDGVDAVVHLAARVRVMNEISINAEGLYRAANVDVTRKLSEAAVAARCRRFIFLSSIKVYGECSTNVPFTALDRPNPQDAYAVSKLEAENVLRAVAAHSDMQVAIIRSPLAYGPGVGGNFLRIMRLVSRGMWLPFGTIENRRSFISVQNLCDFIYHDLATQPGSRVPALISDGEDLSTPELIRRIAAALRVRPRLVKVPVSALRAAGAALGLKAEISRLCDSLYLDSAPTNEQWNWRPPFSVSDSLAATSAWFKDRYG